MSNSNPLAALLNASQEAPETKTADQFKVAKYINVRLFGVLDASIRIFEDPAEQRGMNATQKELHKAIAATSCEDVEALLQQMVIEVVSVKDAVGEADNDAVAKLTKAFASIKK